MDTVKEKEAAPLDDVVIEDVTHEEEELEKRVEDFIPFDQFMATLSDPTRAPSSKPVEEVILVPPHSAEREIVLDQAAGKHKMTEDQLASE